MPTSPTIGLRGGLVVSILLGLLLAVAFPPFGVWPLAPLGVALASWLTRDQPVRRALLLGFVTGFAFFALLLRWLIVIGADAWILLSALEAAFVAVMFVGLALVRRVRFTLRAVPRGHGGPQRRPVHPCGHARHH